MGLPGLAVCAGLALGVAGCGNGGPLPPPGIEITISPAELTLFVGQSAQVVATVTGTPSTAVSFSSSNPSVASVTASGNTAMVTGVAEGAATVVATAAADPMLHAAAAVTVTHGDPFFDEVIIRSITVANTDVPVNPLNVAGQIDVTVSFTRFTADELQVLIGGARADTVVYSQRFGASATAPSGDGPAASPAAIQIEAVVSINTAAVNPTSGAPLFPDGSGYLVKARLLTAGTPIPGVSAVFAQPLTFNNANFMSTTIPAVSSAGRRERAGLAGW